jgi:glycerophosphoryl diester phosphodiesterase
MNWDKFFQLKARLGRPLVMAHRGASALLPENSASAFSRAVADGADIIETDLHFSKDNQLVLIHDATLERTVAAAGNVRDFTLAELQQFILKQPPERAGHVERILTLAELFELTNHAIPLALELKTAQFAEPRYGQILVDELARHGMLEECAVIGFHRERILAVKRLAPALAGGWITLSNPNPRQPTELLGPFWPLLLLNPFYIRRAHALGKIVAPLDPSPEPRLGLYRRMGADVILADNPKLTLTKLEKAKQRT